MSKIQQVVPFQDQVTLVGVPSNPPQLQVTAIRVHFRDTQGNELPQPVGEPLDEMQTMGMMLDYLRMRVAQLAEERKPSPIAVVGL